MRRGLGGFLVSSLAPADVALVLLVARSGYRDIAPWACCSEQESCPWHAEQTWGSAVGSKDTPLCHFLLPFSSFCVVVTCRSWTLNNLLFFKFSAVLTSSYPRGWITIHLPVSRNPERFSCELSFPSRCLHI